MKFRRLVRQAHRWLGLLIGVQLLLWIFGGVVMSALRLDEVRGTDRSAGHTLPPIDLSAPLLPPEQVLHDRPADSLTLSTLLSRPVYRLRSGDDVSLIDARDGSLLSPLSRSLAEAIARADYSGPGTIAGIDWVDHEASEYRGRTLPLWRVRFADERDTALYISASSGEVVARRNRLWRLFDFVWMLHIMDYREREDFNHPLLIATAGTALLFAITGLTMLAYSFRPRSRSSA